MKETNSRTSTGPNVRIRARLAQSINSKFKLFFKVTTNIYVTIKLTFLHIENWVPRQWTPSTRLWAIITTSLLPSEVSLRNYGSSWFKPDIMTSARRRGNEECCHLRPKGTMSLHGTQLNSVTVQTFYLMWFRDEGALEGVKGHNHWPL